MADQHASPQVLRWGRLPNGRFFINVEVEAVVAQGQTLLAPLHGFLLTQEEEDRLKAALGGLVVAKRMPEPEKPVLVH